jgi:hypothetical protein
MSFFSYLNTAEDTGKWGNSATIVKTVTEISGCKVLWWRMHHSAEQDKRLTNILACMTMGAGTLEKILKTDDSILTHDRYAMAHHRVIWSQSPQRYQ